MQVLFVTVAFLGALVFGVCIGVMVAWLYFSRMIELLTEDMAKRFGNEESEHDQLV